MTGEDRHRPEWLNDAPTGFCECGLAYPHPVTGEDRTTPRPWPQPNLDGLVCALCLFVGDSEEPRPITILNGQLSCEPHTGYFQGGDHVQAIIAWKRAHPDRSTP